MITVFTFKIRDTPLYYWAYDSDTNRVSGSYSSLTNTNNCDVPAPSGYGSLQAYITFVSEVNQYTIPPTIVLEYSRDTHPEYFI